MDIIELSVIAAALIGCGVLGRYNGGGREILPESGFIKYMDLVAIGAVHFALFEYVSGIQPQWIDLGLLVAMGLLYTIGEAPGVGQPKGTAQNFHVGQYGIDSNDFEYWQRPELLGKPFVSLAIRGTIWPAPFLVPFWGGRGFRDWKDAAFFVVSIGLCVVLWFYHPSLMLLIPIWAVTMPVSMWLGLRLPKINKLGLSGGWPWSEFLQPIVAGVLIVLVYTQLDG